MAASGESEEGAALLSGVNLVAARSGDRDSLEVGKVHTTLLWCSHTRLRIHCCAVSQAVCESMPFEVERSQAAEVTLVPQYIHRC